MRSTRKPAITRILVGEKRLPEWNHAIVVGASSGIGEAVARKLAIEGTTVALVARRDDLLNKIAGEMNQQRPEIARAFPADVRDVVECQRLFAQITESGVPVDLVVYSSGVMPKDSQNSFPTEDDLTAIQTNFTGAVVWLNAAAQYFQDCGSGTIIGIGSIAGDRGRRGNPVYNATKAALATYLESLRCRLVHTGVTVVTVKPGVIRTAMVGEDRTFPPPANVNETAEHILAAAKKGRRVVYVPWWWQLIAVVLKAMPAWIMERVPV